MIGIQQMLVQRHFEILWDKFCKFSTVEVGYTIWLVSGPPPWEYLSTALQSTVFHEHYSTFQIKSVFLGKILDLSFLWPSSSLGQTL